jgi:uncharacterized small protein (DUF1192 family)
MPVEILTYAALGARLAISAGAARSLARRRRLPRSLSDAGKALVSVDLSDLRYTRRHQRRNAAGHDAAMAARIAALQAEIVRIEATAAGHRTDFERERERADQLMVRLLQATAETMAARETTARLEGALRSVGRTRRSIGGNAVAARSPGLMAADLVAADRKACR